MRVRFVLIYVKMVRESIKFLDSLLQIISIILDDLIEVTDVQHRNILTE